MNRTMGDEVSHRVGEGVKVLSAMRNVWKDRSLSLTAKMGMFESIVALMELYGC